MVQYPNWKGGEPVGYFTRILTWYYRKQIQLEVRSDFKPGDSGLQFNSSALTAVGYAMPALPCP